MAWTVKIEFAKEGKVEATETVKISRAEYGVLPDADDEAKLDLGNKARDVLVKLFGVLEIPVPDPDQRP